MQQTEANKEVVRQFNARVIAGGDWSSFTDFVHPEFVNHSVPKGAPAGAEAFKAFFTEVLHAGLSDIAVVIHDQIAEGDKVATRKVIEGTHTGPFLGAPATGRRVTIAITDIVRLKDGKYFEHWGSADLLGAMNQMSQK